MKRPYTLLIDLDALEYFSKSIAGKHTNSAEKPIRSGLEIFSFLTKLGFNIEIPELTALRAGGILMDNDDDGHLVIHNINRYFAKKTSYGHQQIALEDFLENIALGKIPGMHIARSHDKRIFQTLEELREIVRQNPEPYEATKKIIPLQEHWKEFSAANILGQAFMNVPGEKPRQDTIFILNNNDLVRKALSAYAPKNTGFVNPGGLLDDLFHHGLRAKLGFNEGVLPSAIIANINEQMPSGREATFIFQDRSVERYVAGGANDHYFSHTIEHMLERRKEAEKRNGHSDTSEDTLKIAREIIPQSRISHFEERMLRTRAIQAARKPKPESNLREEKGFLDINSNTPGSGSRKR